ncbi:MAG: hypothetical protein AAF213_02760 [Pseudomonadota bacterium]
MTMPALPSGLTHRCLWHVDWGIDPKKRWAAAITVPVQGAPLIHAPTPFVPLSESLLAGAYDDQQLIIGVDFPIGLPAPYADLVGIHDFQAFLLGQEGPDWRQFSQVADRLDEVSLHQPFFPRANIHADDKAQGPPQLAWLTKLGLEKSDTYRQCDLMTDDRPAAASLFWTKGANQVGKAALGGWRDLVRPLLINKRAILGLWPFDGPLDTLIATAPIVLAETYPGEVYGWFDCQPKAKTRRDARLSVVPVLRATIDDMDLTLTDEANAMLADGFGDDRHGEDRFDSFVGALGLFSVVTKRRPALVPSDPVFTQIEGWILGQEI